MPKLFDELAFSPSVNEILESQAGQHVTVFTGLNNSGKSAYLKKMSFDRSKLYIGVNRFYSFHHMQLYTYNERELDDWYNNLNAHTRSQYQNYEGSFFNTSTALARLSDVRREKLFEVFRDLFELPISVEAEFPENQFSNRFISVDGESLSVTSSGTRLFLGVLAALMDERFSVVALDEPELGLSPTLQARLARIVIDRQYDEDLFPHRPHFVLSTHSHAFLDKKNPGNNFVVTKTGNLIEAERCTGIQELMDIQFRMLGNELSDLFLPDAVVLVEGETDKLFVSTVLRLLLPQFRIVVESCGGDIAARLNYWANTLGEFQASPYRSRTIIVYDSVNQAGLERACNRLGIPADSMVQWARNGIEYVYPLSVLSSVYRAPISSTDHLVLDSDRVSFADLTFTKMELARKVCEEITEGTIHQAEVTDKLVEPLKGILTS